MEKYFKKVPPPESDAKADDLPSNLGERKDKRKSSLIDNTDIEDLPSDPGERKDIMEYLSHQRDEVRRKYLTKVPCQPYGHTFKQILKSGSLRRFNPAWFDQYGSWLEYSMSKERAFCLCCYLFKDEIRMQGGSDAFVKEGFNKLQKLRDDGWNLLMDKIASFCKKHNAGMLIMEDDFVNPKNPRKRSNITNMHHYKVNCFCTVLDLQIQEFNDRFTEVTTDLLICMAALSPTDSFYGFDKEKLMRLAKLYPEDFSYGEILSLEQQLDIYIDNIRRDERFKSVENLGDLSCLMVKTQKHIAHPLVYRLLKLVLTLPVATVSVERCFSAMKLVKTAARNRIGDQFLSDCMVCFVEKELLDSVSNEKVIQRF
ncbi:hypothetical protein BRARA_I01376 [Brassica rapa]|uniref:TTF-type domain-containing protein n=1 Tax=Brassica campestris TaxID=3711 RepID=A0A397XTK6_BRACM|nr:hypothetical protein BRARA_I01376 [Brassica rapa]